MIIERILFGFANLDLRFFASILISSALLEKTITELESKQRLMSAAAAKKNDELCAVKRSRDQLLTKVGEDQLLLLRCFGFSNTNLLFIHYFRTVRRPAKERRHGEQQPHRLAAEVPQHHQGRRRRQGPGTGAAAATGSGGASNGGSAAAAAAAVICSLQNSSLLLKFQVTSSSSHPFA